MLNVSDVFKNLIKHDICYKAYTLTVGSVTGITNSYIYAGSISLKQSIMDELVEFVGCISSELKIKVSTTKLPKADYSGQRVTFSVAVETSSGTWETLKLFTGFVNSCTKTDDGHWQELVCYDALAFLKDVKVFNIYKSAFSGARTIEHLRGYVANALGLTEETTTLVNDAVKVKRRSKNKDMTALDFIKYVCQINGVWGYINPDGELAYKTPSMVNASSGAIAGTFYAGQYPAGYEDGTVEIGTGICRSLKYSNHVLNPLGQGLTIRTNKDDAGVTLDWTNYSQYVGTDPGWDDDTADTYLIDDDDITDTSYIIQGNLFAFKLSKAKKRVMAANIMDLIGNSLAFREFTATTNGMPYIQCGDIVNFVLANGTELKICITSRTLSGDQNLVDSFSCSPSQEYGDDSGSYSTSSGSYVSDISSSSYTAEDGVSTVATESGVTLDGTEVMIVTAWDSSTGILETSSATVGGTS